MIERLYDCIKIYDKKTESLSENLDLHIQDLFEKYVDRIGRPPRYNVWYDTIAPKCIGADDTYENSLVANEASFLTDREKFLNHSRWGLPHVYDHYRTILTGAPFNLYDDGYYENIPDLAKYKDKTILVVGGGPTTNLVDWESHPHDYLWTCNHFFLSPKFKDIESSLIYVNNEINPHDERFQSYVQRHHPLVGLDTSISRQEVQLQTLKNLGCNTFVFSQRIFLTSGTLPKLIAFGTLLQAKEICFVGMDGWSRAQLDSFDSGDHAFEKGKYLRTSKNFDFDFQRREFVVYWDYLLNFSKSTTHYQNLGEPHDRCIHGETTKKLFPLRQE